MSRYCFCLGGKLDESVKAFALAERRSIGNLAVVAIEEYMHRKVADRERVEKRKAARGDLSRVVRENGEEVAKT